MSLSSYPKYRESKVAALGDIPAHWETIAIKRIIDPQRPITYGIVQAGPHIPEGIPYIRPADMTDEKGIRESAALLRTSVEIASSYSRSKVATGDLVCSIGPSFGKVMSVPDWLDGANLTQGTARLAASPSIASSFLFWVLRSDPSVAQWESAIGGATFRALNLYPLANTYCSLPPLNEQNAIAAFLDRETAKIDALVAEQERLIALLKEKRQAVISHAVAKGLNPDAPMKDSGIEWLGEVPAHWTIQRLRHIATLNPSKAETNEMDRSAEVSFMPMEAISENGTLLHGATKPIGEGLSGYTYFREGDVTIAKITPCFENGKGAVMHGLHGGIGFGTTELIVVRAKEGSAIPAYLDWLFRSSFFRGIGEGAMYGAGGQKRVPDDFVRNFVIGVPSVAVQTQIADFLAQEAKGFDALVMEAECVINLLSERRAALISAAVTGKIDVRGLVEQVDMEAA